MGTNLIWLNQKSVVVQVLVVWIDDLDTVSWHQFYFLNSNAWELTYIYIYIYLVTVLGNEHKMLSLSGVNALDYVN